MSYRIRSESQADADAIRTVTEAAFLDAPHTSHTEAYIVDALRRAGALSVSLVAEHDGRVIGHVAVSPVSIAGAAGGWYGLGPISVVPEHQGRGVGALLMRTAPGAWCRTASRAGSAARGRLRLGRPCK